MVLLSIYKPQCDYRRETGLIRRIRLESEAPVWMCKNKDFIWKRLTSSTTPRGRGLRLWLTLPGLYGVWTVNRWYDECRKSNGRVISDTGREIEETRTKWIPNRSLLVDCFGVSKETNRRRVPFPCFRRTWDQRTPEQPWSDGYTVNNYHQTHGSVPVPLVHEFCLR